MIVNSVCISFTTQTNKSFHYRSSKRFFMTFWKIVQVSLFKIGFTYNWLSVVKVEKPCDMMENMQEQYFFIFWNNKNLTWFSFQLSTYQLCCFGRITLPLWGLVFLSVKRSISACSSWMAWKLDRYGNYQKSTLLLAAIQQMLGLFSLPDRFIFLLSHSNAYV